MPATMRGARKRAISGIGLVHPRFILEALIAIVAYMNPAMHKQCRDRISRQDSYHSRLDGEMEEPDNQGGGSEYALDLHVITA